MPNGVIPVTKKLTAITPFILTGITHFDKLWENIYNHKTTLPIHVLSIKS